VSGKNKKSKGFTLTEIIVASAIIGMLVAGLAISMYGFAKFNRYQLVRQQCIAAIMAELDSITTTGKPIPDEDLNRLWPKIDINIKSSPGTGQWQGLSLIEVTANGMSYSKEVKVKLARYVLENQIPAQKVR
jgi:prepilin-type N-terminal cleavage/methylation domain-containing protein